jgi:hypothetical protein
MVCFSKEECDKIINLTLEIEGTHRDVNSKTVERPREKISYTYYNIYRNESLKWIFDKITEYLLVDQNVEIIKPFEVIHLHKYLVGNEFERHSDIYYPNQTLNVGVCLNDDYEGGDFILYGPKQVIPKKAGTIYSFKNTREHEVTKIESGIRYSLIIFLYEENIKRCVSLI